MDSNNRDGGGEKENEPPVEDSRNSLSEAERERFNSLVVKARELAKEGNVQKALKYNQHAYKICRSEKLAKRIQKMEQYLAELGSSDEDGDEMVQLCDDYRIYKGIYDRLYEHQKEGVRWMWKIFKQRKGGILGDDMGLGKTIQVIAFLSGLFDMQEVKSVLIVMPVAVIRNWEREFTKWASGIRLDIFHDISKRERERLLEKHYRRGGVVLTSYGLISTSADMLATKHGRDFVWDSVILDEGHKIKNPSTKCSKAMHKISARHRLILTGTPVQNNLKEMWSLFDWTHSGSLLGTARTFNMTFDGPITRSRQKDATSGEEHHGQAMSKALKKMIGPYFLRRTKMQVTSKSAAGTGGEEENQAGSSLEMPSLQRKNDLVIWSFMSDVQQRIYSEFAASEEVQALLNTSRSPLTALVVLKKICDHPRLLTNRQCLQLGLDMDEGMMDDDAVDEETQNQCAVNRIDHMPDKTLIEESGKMVFLVELLDNLKAEGHRCLVFSQSRKMLDIIQKVIGGRGHRALRLDGTVRHTAEREDIIKKFSENLSYSVFLLTTQVGGVGLTLTAADRVVIFDPSWNPATDAQAVDRAFRIGQDKDVVIYRLITCGSIEEKIYRRQIFKDSIIRQTTGDSTNPYKYFTKQQLYELFTLGDTKSSDTQEQLAEMHAGKRNTDTSLDAHIAMLHSLHMYGISDHDLMFSKDAEIEESDPRDSQYAAQKVQEAHQMLTLENEETENMVATSGKYLGGESTKISRPGFAGKSNWQFPRAEPRDSDEEDLENDVQELKLKSEDDSEEEPAMEASPGKPPALPPYFKPLLPKIENGTAETFKPLLPKLESGTAETPICLDTPASTPIKPGVSPFQPRQVTSNIVLDSESEEESSDTKSSSRSDGGSDDEMVVGDSLVETESAGESFHTPDNSASSTGSGSPSSGQKREIKSVDNRSAKRRRRSVAWTPGGGNMLERKDDSEMENVVQEELQFSPKKCLSSDLSTMSVVSTDYDSWKTNVPSNSTFCAPRQIPRPIFGSQDSDIEEEDEEDDGSAKETIDSVVPSTSVQIVSPGSHTIQNTPGTGSKLSTTYEDSPVVSTSKKGARRPLPSEDACEDSPLVLTSKKGARRPLPSEDSDNEVVFTPRGIKSNPISPSSWQKKGTPVMERSPLPRPLISEDEDEGEGAQEDQGSPQQYQSFGEQDQSMNSATEGVSPGSDRSAGTSQHEGAEITEDEVAEEESEEEEEEESEEEEEESEEEEAAKLTPEQQEKYVQVMTSSRALYKKGEYGPALALALDALEIYSGDERAQMYALKLHNKLEGNA